MILLYFCISLRSIRAICESVCCLDSTQLIVIWTPAIGWVHPLYSSSSQSAEQSAESSHMSDFGLRFFFFLFLPSTCQDKRRRRRDQNKPADWFAASHQLVFSKRAVLLKGKSPFIVVIIMLLLLLFISTNHATKENKRTKCKLALHLNCFFIITEVTRKASFRCLFLLRFCV